MKLFDRIAGLFFPRRCIFCGSIIESGYCCEKCSPPKIGSNACMKCGRDHDRCVCRELSYSFMSATAPFYYSGCAKHALISLKEGDAAAAEGLSEEICSSLLRRYDKDIISSFDFVAFVPMHCKKRRQKGFDHAEMLAKLVAKRFGLPVKDVLIRTREGTAQHTLNAQQRKRNVIGLYDCKSDLSDMSILLIDDIFTTGATLNECSKQLIKCGAVCVVAAVAALAQPNEYMISAAQHRYTDSY